MVERRAMHRRKEDRDVYAAMQEQIDEIHRRVFNGLGKELRQEVKEEIDTVHRKMGGLYKSIGALLLTLLLVFAGIIVEGRVSAQRSTEENMRNYKAILDLEQKLEIHMVAPGGGE